MDFSDNHAKILHKQGKKFTHAGSSSSLFLALIQ